MDINEKEIIIESLNKTIQDLDINWIKIILNYAKIIQEKES